MNCWLPWRSATRSSPRADRARILDEFTAVTGYHRKHAMRLLRTSPSQPVAARQRRRLYDAAVRAALILLSEASDRICGKRLNALIPTLMPAIERHGHLTFAAEIRAALLSISAATIDRALRPQREHASAGGRRRGAASAIRRAIPVRTCADWCDPPPGFVEADLVAHSGPTTSGAFVQTLVLTDIAAGRMGAGGYHFVVGAAQRMVRSATLRPNLSICQAIDD